MAVGLNSALLFGKHTTASIFAFLLTFVIPYAVYEIPLFAVGALLLEKVRK
jgi:hypothetical protein